MAGADLLGWTAAALMVATFSCRDARRMRPLAVCTNLAFIVYGCSAGLAPVVALHALLLPINLLRWRESRAPAGAAGKAARTAPGACGPAARADAGGPVTRPRLLDRVRAAQQPWPD